MALWRAAFLCQKVCPPSCIAAKVNNPERYGINLCFDIMCQVADQYVLSNPEYKGWSLERLGFTSQSNVDY